MKVLEAFERLKGYCDKQKDCIHCKFHSDDEGCALEKTVPCNWEIPKGGDTK